MRQRECCEWGVEKADLSTFTAAASDTRSADAAMACSSFMPQISRRSTAPPLLEARIVVEVDCLEHLSASEQASLRKMPSALPQPSGTFSFTLTGDYPTVGSVRKAIGAARGCDPDIVGLATEDGPLLDDEGTPPPNLQIAKNQTRAERSMLRLKSPTFKARAGEALVLAAHAHSFKRASQLAVMPEGSDARLSASQTSHVPVATPLETLPRSRRRVALQAALCSTDGRRAAATVGAARLPCAAPPQAAKTPAL